MRTVQYDKTLRVVESTKITIKTTLDIALSKTWNIREEFHGQMLSAATDRDDVVNQVESFRQTNAVTQTFFSLFACLSVGIRTKLSLSEGASMSLHLTGTIKCSYGLYIRLRYTSCADLYLSS